MNVIESCHSGEKFSGGSLNVFGGFFVNHACFLMKCSALFRLAPLPLKQVKPQVFKRGYVTFE